MAYSKDYRQMIIDKLDEDYRYRELAEEHQISTTTIQRWRKSIERNAYVYKVDEAKRQSFIEQLALYQKSNHPIVYLDESGFKFHDYRP